MRESACQPAKNENDRDHKADTSDDIHWLAVARQIMGREAIEKRAAKRWKNEEEIVFSPAKGRKERKGRKDRKGKGCTSPQI